MGALQIKVCGMREPANIREIAACGPDWMGLIFYEQSRRYVRTHMTGDELQALGLSVPLIGVFVNASLDEVHEAIRAYGLAGVQLHGEESPSFCGAIREAWPSLACWKVMGVDAQTSFGSLAPYASVCTAFLFDTHVPEYGGSGQMFDWSLLSAYEEPTPFYVAGGVGPKAVPAIRALQAQESRFLGVDLNSKVEEAPGRKSPDAVAQVIQELRH
jgi:phosphoribosylanthranilate isomerase